MTRGRPTCTALDPEPRLLGSIPLTRHRVARIRASTHTERHVAGHDDEDHPAHDAIAALGPKFRVRGEECPTRDEVKASSDDGAATMPTSRVDLEVPHSVADRHSAPGDRAHERRMGRWLAFRVASPGPKPLICCSTGIPKNEAPALRQQGQCASPHQSECAILRRSFPAATLAQIGLLTQPAPGRD